MPSEEHADPQLVAARAGGRLAPGGRSQRLPSTTYPSFASLLTGHEPEDGHPNDGPASRRRARVGPAETAAGPTIVHAARDAGLRTTAVVMGDHKLQKVLRLDEIDRAWPPAGIVPDGTELDAHGYPTNAAIRPHAWRPPRIRTWICCSSTSTRRTRSATIWARTAAATIECVRAADAIVGEVLEALAGLGQDRDRGRLGSRHDSPLPYPAIDPTASRDCAGLVDDWIADGCAAWLRLTPGVDAHMAINRLTALEGVEAWRWREPNVLAAAGGSGPRLCRAVDPDRRDPRLALHGPTLAIVGGGHPAVPTSRHPSSARPPRLRGLGADAGRLLGIELPDADGSTLLERSELADGGLEGRGPGGRPCRAGLSPEPSPRGRPPRRRRRPAAARTASDRVEAGHRVDGAAVPPDLFLERGELFASVPRRAVRRA
jgi:hypothetical protein